MLVGGMFARLKGLSENWRIGKEREYSMKGFRYFKLLLREGIGIDKGNKLRTQKKQLTKSGLPPKQKQ